MYTPIKKKKNYKMKYNNIYILYIRKIHIYIIIYIYINEIKISYSVGVRLL